MRHAEGLRCLHRIETTTTTIYSVFRLGFAVFKQDIKRYRRVGALLLNSLCNDVTTFLKFWTDYTDLSLIMELKLSEQMAAISLRRTCPTTLTTACFVAWLFFTH